MGICLDTDKRPVDNSGQFSPMESKNGGLKMNGGNKVDVQPGNMDDGHPSNGSAKANGNLSQWETPSVPVIFVLGGPGSGKITHSEQIAKDHPGLLHVNVTQILQSILKGTDLYDMSLVPTKQLTASIMAAIKAKPHATAYIISGYPRNMRDSAEYLEKIGRVDGVILLNWHDSSLERQVAYGAKMGGIEMEAAKTELKAFKKHVIPVAEYFDYKRLLYVITGERKPEFVYEDFLSVFNKIMDSEKKIKPTSAGSYREYKNSVTSLKEHPPKPSDAENAKADEVPEPLNGNMIWVMGGPGSNKFARVEKCIEDNNAWRCINTGRLLWNLLERVDMDPGKKELADTLKETMKKGDLVPQELMIDLIVGEMRIHNDAEGFIVTGFPRNITQAKTFEKKLQSKPPVILLDCSEIELGRNLGQRRGRLDDNLEAYKRRLELYRELTLPMLKTLDEEERLMIVDGDAEPAKVIEELEKVLKSEIAAKKLENTLQNDTKGEEENNNPDDEHLLDELEKEIKTEEDKLENEIENIMEDGSENVNFMVPVEEIKA